MIYRLTACLIAFVMCLATSGAQALTQKEALALLDRGAFAELDTRLNALNAKVVRKAARPDEIREVFGLFGRVDPDLAKQVETWRKTTASPNAMMADAWMRYHAAWVMRGTDTARFTHPMAFEAFQQLMGQAANLSQQIKWQRPLFIPNTDLQLYLENEGFAHASDSVVRNVMANFPNGGTVTRTLKRYASQWGGSFEGGRAFCHHYGAMAVADWGDNGAKICELYLIQWFYPDQFTTMHKLWMDGAEGADMAHLRTRFTVSHGIDDPVWIAETSALFDGLFYDDIRFADRYDRFVAQPRDLKPAMPRVAHRAVEKARKTLETEPYNLEMMHIAAWPGYSRRDAQGHTHNVRIDPPLSAPQRLSMLRRALVVAPYDADRWMVYGRWLTNVGSPAQAQGAFANAVAYSNHDPRRIVDVLDHAYTWKLSNAALRIGRLDVADRPAEIAELADLTCPATRLIRLHAAMCDQIRSPWCQAENAKAVETTSQTLQTLQTLGQEAKVCKEVADAPIEALIYHPTGLDPQND